MAGKPQTVSARFSSEQVELLNRLQEELAISKTDVLQMALEALSRSRSTVSGGTVAVPVSADTMRRAMRLHHDYGLKHSLEALLSEALDIGVRELRRTIESDRKGDLDLARSDMDAGLVEVQRGAVKG